MLSMTSPGLVAPLYLIMASWCVGTKRIAAGRKGEGPAIGLAKTLEDAGFRMGRLRTGTPPRLRASTIDYTGLGTQPSDVPAAPFSFMNSQVKHEGNFVTCHMTHTNRQAHQYVLGRT
jgi:tRNA uridine 5-carboxymethylaminomethyl modification enzyme